MKAAVAKTSLTDREERLVSMYQVLADKTRYKIFKILLSKEEYCVSDVAAKVGVSVPAASQHFRIFELVGLVDKHRYGQKICYVLKNDNRLAKDLVKWVAT
ncbi:winged helix-turn-helix transcriptional regulator [Candidatus Saccharibacteria bacterium]|nr:winged helix-turn-helix transcriptional regulator [Candidatus Saccharibacteria bacterium]